MDDKESLKPEIDFDRLNLLGKAVFLTGQAARAATSVIELLVDQAASVIAEAERAFLEGYEPGIEEAKVLEEYEEPRKKKHARNEA